MNEWSQRGLKRDSKHLKGHKYHKKDQSEMKNTVSEIKNRKNKEQVRRGRGLYKWFREQDNRKHKSRGIKKSFFKMKKVYGILYLGQHLA